MFKAPQTYSAKARLATIMIRASHDVLVQPDEILLGFYRALCSLSAPEELLLREEFEHLNYELWMDGFLAGDHPEEDQ